MALVFLEGFGGYATGAHSDAAGADPKLQFDSWNSSITLTAFESGGDGNRKYMTCGGEPSMDMKFNDTTFDSTTVVVGFRIYHTGQGTFQPIWLFDASDGLGCVAFDSYGYFQFSKPGTGSSGLDSSIPPSDRAVPRNTWCYVEVKVTFSNTTGTVDYYIDGVNVGSHTTLDTIQNGTSCDRVFIGYAAFYQQTWRSQVRITDIYVDDATVRGPMEVWYQAADTAGSAANWTPNTGTNHAAVDDIGSDGDTTYVQSTATSTKDQIAHGDSLSVAPLALQPMVMTRAETTAENLQVGVLSDPGGTPTEDLDTATSISSTDYEGLQGKVYETDPDTGSAWTAANADAAETVYNHAA